MGDVFGVVIDGDIYDHFQFGARKEVMRRKKKERREKEERKKREI